VTLRAEVSEQSGDRIGIRFSVEDTGIGIPPEQQSKLFKNFVQADDSMTRKYGGTGLGLAISKQLVELMKGRIGFESTEGKGSKFWFTAEFGRRAADSDEQPVPDLSGLRVLVVDRKKSSLSPLHRHLPNWGCKTEVVDHGSLVVPTLKKAAAARPFRIALIDLELAAQDGLSVESSIKMDPEIGRTSLIAVTSSPMRGDGLKVHRAGYSGYLAKPFEPEDLRGVIAEVLRNENRLEPPLATRHTVAEQRSRPRIQDKKKHAKPVETPRTVKQPVEAQQSVLPKPRAKATSKAAADNGSKSKALIAEDNLVNQKIAARLLQRVGLDVDVVSNGLEAVKACETTAYDLILMDCQMPEMDGFEATERIRRLENNGRRTPICALTAHAMKSDREKCLASGMDDYLTKPVDAKKLGDMVKKLIPQEAGKAAGASR
jgi:CheY-like chemotaxis protein